MATAKAEFLKRSDRGGTSVRSHLHTRGSCVDGYRGTVHCEGTNDRRHLVAKQIGAKNCAKCDHVANNRLQNQKFEYSLALLQLLTTRSFFPFLSRVGFR